MTRRTTLQIFFGLFLVVCGLPTLVIGAAMIQHGLASTSWPRTTGRILVSLAVRRYTPVAG